MSALVRVADRHEWEFQLNLDRSTISCANIINEAKQGGRPSHWLTDPWWAALQEAMPQEVEDADEI